jgi:hypothetical protein
MKERHNRYSKAIAAGWGHRTPSLNSDIVESVFRHFDRPFHEFNSLSMLDYYTLHSVRLVSRAWLEPGPRHMYRTIRMTSSHFQQLIQCIVKSPSLGKLVRQLRLDAFTAAHFLFPNTTTVWCTVGNLRRRQAQSLGRLGNVTHMPKLAELEPRMLDPDISRIATVENSRILQK